METFSLIIRLFCIVLFVTLLIHHLRNNNKGEDMSNFEMKSKIITGLKKEVLVIEAKSKDIACGFIFNKYGLKELLKWEVLGTPDEIKEEDVIFLVETDEISDVGDYRHQLIFIDYQDEEKAFETALESFNSALESEIYWENPVKLFDMDNLLKAKHIAYDEIKKFNEAELCTFDKKRTLIFVKD